VQAQLAQSVPLPQALATVYAVLARSSHDIQACNMGLSDGHTYAFIMAIHTARHITSSIKPAGERSTWSAQSPLVHGNGNSTSLSSYLSSIL